MRSVLKAGLLVLGFLALFLANLLVWLDSSVFDSGEFSQSVDHALAEPEVQQRIADAVATEVVTRGELSNRIDGRLPPDAAFLTPIVAGEMERMVAALTRELLAGAPAQGLRNELIAGLHDRVLTVLEDRGTAVRPEDDDIVIDGRGVILRVFERIGVAPPAALQKDSSAGRIVLVEDVGGLREVSYFLRNRQAIQTGLLVAAALCFGGAVVTSRDRRGGVVATGAVVLGVGLVTLLIVILGNLALTEWAPERVVGREILRALEANLRLQSLLLMLAGGAVILAADLRLNETLERAWHGAGIWVERTGAGGLIVGGLVVGGLALIFA